MEGLEPTPPTLRRWTSAADLHLVIICRRECHHNFLNFEDPVVDWSLRIFLAPFIGSVSPLLHEELSSTCSLCCHVQRPWIESACTFARAFGNHCVRMTGLRANDDVSFNLRYFHDCLILQHRAAGENRTPVVCASGRRSTIELQPQIAPDDWIEQPSHGFRFEMNCAPTAAG